MIPVHEGVRKTGELFRALRFFTSDANASPLLAVTSARPRATSTVVSNHSVGSIATRPRPRASAAPAMATAMATTCNGFRRVDRVSRELIKY